MMIATRWCRTKKGHTRRPSIAERQMTLTVPAILSYTSGRNTYQETTTNTSTGT
ncbi:unnamed protein product [Amoebophrya sp. A25]|nr:unnamed protein product [Amoebophrya sp. A25]CAD7969063.1 unnamed protein product [Amoebophrya sp. A25]CAD7969065.1 unnamed protein product [Amoebophrya sp. A25]|eukprot:GSA25T00022153001.1